MFVRIPFVSLLCTNFMNWRIISSQAVWLESEQVGQHDPMNKSNLRPTATLLAGILFKIARQGYEAELKPDLKSHGFDLGAHTTSSP